MTMTSLAPASAAPAAAERIARRRARLRRWLRKHPPLILGTVLLVLMAIPDIMLAIALMSVTRASLTTVIVAITVPQVPRVVRLVRSLTLRLREQQYVKAARARGTRLPVILWRHVLPNMVTPLVVQATFIAATAMLTEALLSFLGVGLPPHIPSWGTMMADSRNFVAVAFHAVLFPGLFLAATVLSVNLVGDGLRDALDPRLSRQL